MRWIFYAVLVLLCGFLFVIMVPNHVGGGPSKLRGIINNLRQIDAAKMQWALEHGVTNLSQVSIMTNQLAEQDLAQYLKFPSNSLKQNGLVPSYAGEIYFIKALNESPEAKLTRKSNLQWPKGSIIRFATNTNAMIETILPDGTKTYSN